MSTLQDALRAVFARPGYALTVICSLAIGIGANVLLYAVVDAAILRPLPFPALDRLVGIGADYPRLNQPLEFFEALSGPEYVDIRTGVPSLEHVTGFDLGNEAVAVGDTPERVFTAFTWDDPLAVMQVSPIRGRSFDAAELASAVRVAVVSYAFWQSRFGGRDDAVGRVLRIGGQPFTLIGVLPPGATLYGVDLWLPFGETAATIARNRRQFNVVARLRDGATLVQADAELETLERRIEAAHGSAFGEYAGWRLRAERWTRIDRWPFERSTLIVFAGAALLLLLVCGNLASLTLARTGSRQQELAVRSALGASRTRLAVQVLTEAGVLAAAGTTAGLLIAQLGARALPSILPATMVPWDTTFTLDWRIAAFTCAAGAAAALLVALVPALHAARADVRGVLARSSGALAGLPAARVQRAIVALEVALAVMVAAAAVLLGSSVARLLRVDPGFPTDGLTAMRLTLPTQRYDGDARLRFFETLLERVRALPDVVEAAMAMQYPPNVFTTSQFAIEGRDDAGALPTAFHTIASSRLLETLQVRLVAGRWVNDESAIDAPLEVVVNATAAARYFPGGALGKRIRIDGPAGHSRWAEIVGVTAAVRNRGPAFDPQPEIFTSLRQAPERRRSQLSLIVRSRQGGDGAATAATAVRAIVRKMDPEQPVYSVSSVTQNFASGLGSRRVASQLLTVFGAVALGLSALGIYGVLSYSVARRTREIGLRAALGASRRAVVLLIAFQALVPVALGLSAGCLGLLALRRTVGAFLFGIEPSPGPLAIVIVLTLASAGAATLVPLRRALKIDAAAALRNP